MESRNPDLQHLLTHMLSVKDNFATEEVWKFEMAKLYRPPISGTHSRGLSTIKTRTSCSCRKMVSDFSCVWIDRPARKAAIWQGHCASLMRWDRGRPSQMASSAGTIISSRRSRSSKCEWKSSGLRGGLLILRICGWNSKISF